MFLFLLIAIIYFITFTIVFILAECDVKLPKLLTKYMGIDRFRGVKPYNVEDYYG